MRTIRACQCRTALKPAPMALSRKLNVHGWGYAAQPGGCCFEYEVQHSQWRVWKRLRALRPVAA